MLAEEHLGGRVRKLLPLREACLEQILAEHDRLDIHEASIRFAQLAIPDYLQFASFDFAEQETQSLYKIFMTIDSRWYAVSYHVNAVKLFLGVVGLQRFLNFTEYSRIRAMPWSFMEAYLQILPVSIEADPDNPMLTLARSIYTLPNTGGQSLKWSLNSLIMVGNELLRQDPATEISKTIPDARLRTMIRAVLERCENMLRHIEVLYKGLGLRVLEVIYLRMASSRSA